MCPRSSTRVFRPFSVSSLAAQPPLIPEPTTIASNEFCSMLYWAPRKNSADYGPSPRDSGSVSRDQPDPDRGVRDPVQHLRRRRLLRDLRQHHRPDLGGEVLL